MGTEVKKRLEYWEGSRRQGLPGTGTEGQGGVPVWCLLGEGSVPRKADARVRMRDVKEIMSCAEREGAGEGKEREREK